MNNHILCLIITYFHSFAEVETFSIIRCDLIDDAPNVIAFIRYHIGSATAVLLATRKSQTVPWQEGFEQKLRARRA